MVISEFKRALASTREVQITVTGRKSGRKISIPVWFVHEADRVYLLPVEGSESDWYKNLVRTPVMDLSAKRARITTEPKLITDAIKVKEVAEKFRAKYGAAEVKKYYSKFDVCVEVSPAS